MYRTPFASNITVETESTVNAVLVRPRPTGLKDGGSNRDSRSHDAVTRVYDAGNVIETHEHTGEFKEP
jgi:hypothetical protein